MTQSADGSRSGGQVFSVEGLGKRFGATEALSDVDLTVGAGEVHALVGGNGSGKSTLIKVLAGVVHADRGTLRMGSSLEDLAHFTPSDSHAIGFRFVHQDLGIFEELTVVENLGLGGGFGARALARVSWRSQGTRAEHLLGRFGLRVRAGDKAAKLSVPQRTILAIARALGDHEEGEAGLLVLDEPTAALAPDEAALVLETVRRLADQGTSVLLVTHRLDEVRAVADRVTGLRDGRNSGTLAADDLEERALVQLILGHPGAAPTGAAERVATVGTPMLKVRGLRGGCLAPTDLDLGAGEILGVAGLEGSGRTELLRLVFGADRRADGTVEVDGMPVAGTARSACRAGIGMVPENRLREGIFPAESVRVNLTEGGTSAYFRGWRLRAGRERSETARDLSSFRIKAASPETPIEFLSGGNQQKVVLARWLRRGVKVLLLDEPTQGVDLGGREEIYGLIRDAAAKGSGILIVSSEYEELARLCHRVVTLVDGAIVSELSQPFTAHDLLEKTVVMAGADR